MTDIEYYKLCFEYTYVPTSHDSVDRIVTFGDIHGDLPIAKKLLEESGIAEFTGNTPRWIGGTTYLVQVGDMIDSYRHIPGIKRNSTPNDQGNDIVIMDIFNSLSRQAREAGGAVLQLWGNHELMNVIGFMDYVSQKNLDIFKNYSDPADPTRRFSSGEEARKHAFSQGNQYANMLGCTRIPAVVIGRNLFVHGGIVDRMIGDEPYDRVFLEKLSGLMNQWANDKLDRKKYGTLNIKKYMFDKDYSMFWNKLLGKDLKPGLSMANDPECKDNIENVLSAFDIDRIIVGHVPQPYAHNVGINSTCSGRVWRVDTGSTTAFDHFNNVTRRNLNRPVQYLEILNDNKCFIRTI